MTTYTPMMQQYLSIKSEYKDAFLFFRLGDFYEMFFEDAEKASQILEITLTSRDAGSPERIPMCGVPYHSAKGYIETLVSKGYKVAICEQTEDPKQAKGVVKREVVQLITPGTITEGKTIDGKSNHYIASAEQLSEDSFAFVYLDISTGEANSSIIEGGAKTLLQQLQAYNIQELVVTEQLHLMLAEQAIQLGIVLSIEQGEMNNQQVEHYLIDLPEAIKGAAKVLLQYIERTQMRSLSHIRPFKYTESKQYLRIDTNSKRNLELLESIRGGDQKGTLLWLLDETVTAMGGRKLKQWLHQPLANLTDIENRLSIVTDLLDEFFLRNELRELLKSVYDLERLAGRIAFGNVGGRDLAQLRESLRQVPAIKSQLLQSGKTTLMALGQKLDECAEVEQLLSRAITDHPPIAVKEGDVIREGYNEKLDELRFASRNGKDWIAALEQKERELTGIKNLKIGYNRIFGYYIEVTKSNIGNVDLSRYNRKQTLANAERYITEELKEKEAIILNAEEQSLALEYDLFVSLREEIKSFIPRLQALASEISELDVYIGFAVVAEKYRFVKPTFHNGRAMKIVNGRHPVVEKMLHKQSYVPNDCILTEDKNMMLITGPNMSGKSTYMRQVALIVVLAQMGCYVPADEANLPITDQIFTRIGAADDLAAGQSTFMVEMLESQNAITNATDRSLLLFDEIGRGTSTYDGMALAQSMMEYIHDKIGANTLFSTHYHELTALEEDLIRLQNVHVSASEKDGRVVFLHKVKKGAADKSYGVHVAQLAEMPEAIIERARILLEQFESKDVQFQPKESVKEVAQLSLFEEATVVEEIASSVTTDASTDEEKLVIEKLEKLNIMGTSPIQAMNILYELQQMLLNKK
ncbi:DNA mismatch repair protein MutS [Ureibacillus massiliensis 4400831 = CIP 108448 = CCUG 49529]|uniref:DNA mismatch repair protein MutS n=1 Tax=Ureibacillus massiliensis 4400831 = CIP 108448 = CCUG 49529 TaxID=1211035 RepID=A0A0A3JW41_9BACL|nr:DNA mismatch repair protein MutS [Ureibacillus massiliensis]KGR91227.1 DNA mismatch repair protein MutS [Ureibacillus massiliensis 4400831 = CIP 108448 = CCUG 49529]